MRYPKFPILLIALLVLPALCAGCKGSGKNTPTNPFAKDRQTVPPPATFSSQGSYLGQTPGTYVPQTPAAMYPPSGTVTPQPSPIPSNVPLPSPTTPAPSGSVGSANDPGASLFNTSTNAQEPATGWTAANVTSTSQTAFQNMEAKVNSVSYIDENGVQKTTVAAPESLIVGSSQVLTTVKDDSAPNATLAEPQLLYSGKYAGE